MAESSSSVMPGDVEWLPGPRGSRLLRIHPSSPDPPALILRTADGAEWRFEAGPGAQTEYEIPGELDWDAAWLAWPDGTRATIPAPHGRAAEVIELRPRRFRSAAAPDQATDAAAAPRDAGRSGESGTAPRDAGRSGESGAARRDAGRSGESGAARGDAGRSAESSAAPSGVAPSGAAPRDAVLPDGSARGPAARGDAQSGAAPREPASPPAPAPSDAPSTADVAETSLPRGFVRVSPSVEREASTGPSWTTPPQLAAPTAAEREWRERGEDVERELAQASAAIARAREGERLAREAVLTALTAARADLRAVRAARDADASAFAALSGELEAERSAHAVTRGSIGTLADALATARTELAAAREAAEIARAAGQEARATVASARRDAALARAEAASLRSALEVERAARASAEAELRELNDRAGLLQRVADFDRDAAGLRDQVELERRAREQAEVAAAAARRPPAEAKRLLADLDAAAHALRAATDRTAADDRAPTSPTGARAASEDVPNATTPGDASRADSRPAAAPARNVAPGATTRPGEAAPTATSAASDAPRHDARAAGSDSWTAATPARNAGPAATTPLGNAAPAAGDASRADSRPAAGNAAPGATTPRGDVAPPTRHDDAPPPDTTRAVAASTALVRADADLRLRNALLALSREDATAAGALLVGLLPAQGAVLEGSLSYDLTVRGIGTFAVSVEDGSARVVRLSRKRPRGEALFHLAGDPVTLVELLAGERTKLTRLRRKARVTGRRKRARELAKLPEARLSLAEAVKAGARLEPALVYRALPFAIDPEWTKGHRFTVAQQIAELAPQSWHVHVRDGLPLQVVEHAAESPADATVTMSRAAFERLLKDEPQPLGDRPQIRGDREAVAALKRWTDLARGAE